jgi:serine protease Do
MSASINTHLPLSVHAAPAHRAWLFGIVSGLVAAALLLQLQPFARNGGVALGKGGGGPVAAAAVTALEDLDEDRASYANSVERAIRSVVNISTEKLRRQRAPMHPFFFEPFHQVPKERRERSLGSGVIMSEDGVVLTNNHVVEGATKIVVTLSDGRTFEAKVIGTDPKSDVAVIRLDTKGLPAIEVGNSSQLRTGDVVLAIGNPFGVGQTVTRGIVSALGRTNVHITDYEDFIQTDAAINPGNSGGALITTDGKLVGVNTAILSRSGGSQGIGFAIPTTMAVPLMSTILSHGKVIRGYLGVVIQDISEDIRKALDLSARKGALVARVEDDSPASRAGIKRGDVIVELADQRVENTGSLRNRVALMAPGAEAEVVVIRDSRKKSLTVKVGQLGGPSSTAGAAVEGEGSALSGVKVSPLTEERARRLGLPPDVHGVVVEAVDGDSAAARHGLRPGDVILEIGRKAVQSPKGFARAARESGDTVLLLISRRGRMFYTVVRAK